MPCANAGAGTLMIVAANTSSLSFFMGPSWMI
jgi:hypothetical protein